MLISQIDMCVLQASHQRLTSAVWVPATVIILIYEITVYCYLHFKIKYDKFALQKKRHWKVIVLKETILQGGQL
jgi:hypothetical protein